MILKIAVIVLSVVAIVLASIVIGGVLIIGQVLENDPNIRSGIRQWLGAEGGSDLGQIHKKKYRHHLQYLLWSKELL